MEKALWLEDWRRDILILIAKINLFVWKNVNNVRNGKVNIRLIDLECSNQGKGASNNNSNSNNSSINNNNNNIKY